MILFNLGFVKLFMILFNLGFNFNVVRTRNYLGCF